jgi:hypothetical protein
VKLNGSSLKQLAALLSLLLAALLGAHASANDVAERSPLRALAELDRAQGAASIAEQDEKQVDEGREDSGSALLPTRIFIGFPSYDKVAHSASLTSFVAAEGSAYEARAPPHGLI